MRYGWKDVTGPGIRRLQGRGGNDVLVEQITQTWGICISLVFPHMHGSTWAGSLVHEPFCGAASRKTQEFCGAFATAPI